METLDQGAASAAPRPRRRRRINAEQPIEQTLAEIRLYGRMLDDVEHVRKMARNREASMGRRFGSTHGVTMLRESLEGVEKEIVWLLETAWLHHPLAPWAKSVPGVGEKSIAR